MEGSSVSSKWLKNRSKEKLDSENGTQTNAAVLQEPGKKSKQTHVRVWRDDHKKLMNIRSSRGFSSLAWVVNMLLEEKDEHTPNVEELLKSTVPSILSGRPLAGKSFFVKQKLLPALAGSPVLVIDKWDEYKDLREIGLGGIYGLDVKDFKEHIRFVPNRQSKIGELEVENLFAYLDIKGNDMANWIIIVEEANAYKNCPAFTSFLYGSRHVVRKMIAVTPQLDAFQGLEILTVHR